MNRITIGSIALAGALVTTSALCAQRTIPVFAATPELRIDAGENDLSRIGWVLPLRNGEIAVGQNQDHLVRFFDVAGHAAGAFGRFGAGPGEFHVIGIAGTIGDTLWIGDGQNDRTTYIGPNHKLVRTEPFTSAVKANAADENGLPSATNFGLIMLARYANGSFLTEVHLGSGKPRPAWYPIAAPAGVWVRVSRSGVFEHVIAIAPALQTQCQAAGMAGGFHVTAWIPFCDQGTRQVAADGSRITFVFGNGIAGSPTIYRLLVIAASGDTLIKRDYSYLPVALPKRVTDSIIDRVVSRPETSPDLEGMYRHMAFPPSYPPVLRAVSGLDGTTWLEEPSITPGHHWRILDRKGDPIGTVVVPASVMVTAAERHQIWGADTDADGLQSVVRYRVGNGPPR